MRTTSIKKSPYFFPAEVVRAIARALNGKTDKANNDLLDSKCQDLYLSKNELDQLINIHIHKVIERVGLKKSVENELKALVAQMFDDYLKIVATYNLSEQHRDDIGTWIIEAFFCPHLINIVSFLGIRTKPFQKSDYIELMTDNSTGLESAFKIIEKLEGWNAFYAGLPKGDKDKITAWRRRGDDLPSYSSLLAILNPKHHDMSKNVLAFLITARAIGYFKRHNDIELLTQYFKSPKSLEALMVQFEDLLLALNESDMQYVATLYQKKDEQFLHRPSTIILELL